MKELFPKEPLLRSSTLSEKSDEARRLIFTDSARSAWRTLLDAFKVRTTGPRKVLLPAYIGYTDREGSGVFDPVRDTESPFSFYAVDTSLKTAIHELKTHLESGDIGVLLVVHWFGFAHVDMNAVSQLCRQHNVLLVEDCAHVLGPVRMSACPLGSIGDAAIYSLHKMYGGSAGGALALNTPSGFALDPRDRKAISDDFAIPPCPREVMEALLAVDPSAVAKHRREMYERTMSGLSRIPGLRPLFPELGNSTPQTLPVVVENSLREPLYFALREQGITLTALYYRLIPEVTEEQFAQAFEVSRSILNFPVHQSVPQVAIDEVVNRTSDALARLSG